MSLSAYFYVYDFLHINQAEAQRRTIYIFVHTLNVFVVVVVALVLVCDLLLSNTQSDFSFALGHTFNVYTNTDNVVRKRARIERDGK